MDVICVWFLQSLGNHIPRLVLWDSHQKQSRNNTLVIFVKYKKKKVGRRSEFKFCCRQLLVKWLRPWRTLFRADSSSMTYGEHYLHPMRIKELAQCLLLSNQLASVKKESCTSGSPSFFAMIEYGWFRRQKWQWLHACVESTDLAHLVLTFHSQSYDSNYTLQNST